MEQTAADEELAAMVVEQHMAQKAEAAADRADRYSTLAAERVRDAEKELHQLKGESFRVCLALCLVPCVAKVA